MNKKAIYRCSQIEITQGKRRLIYELSVSGYCYAIYFYDGDGIFEKQKSYGEWLARVHKHIGAINGHIELGVKDKNV